MTADYDPLLAARLGADERGMRMYVFVTLLSGPTKVGKEEAQKIFSGHMSNMNRLAEAGKLVLAGPFSGGEPKRGLWVLAVDSIEEAEELVKTDPGVQAGVFDYELTRWYGSAAVMQLNEIHGKIQRASP